jgi:hypothetical protein
MELDGQSTTIQANDFATFRTGYAHMLRTAWNDPLYKGMLGVLCLMQKNRGSATFGIGFSDHFLPSFARMAGK